MGLAVPSPAQLAPVKLQLTEPVTQACLMMQPVALSTSHLTATQSVPCMPASCAVWTRTGPSGSTTFAVQLGLISELTAAPDSGHQSPHEGKHNVNRLKPELPRGPRVCLTVWKCKQIQLLQRCSTNAVAPPLRDSQQDITFDHLQPVS